MKARTTEAEEVLDDIADENGWEHRDKYQLLLEFIEDNELVEDLEDFLREKAEDNDDDEEDVD